MAVESLIITPANDREPSRDSAGISRDQIRGSSLFLIGNVISLAITFFPHLVLVRYLSTEEYGSWAYALSVVAVAKTYALGFNEALSRFVPIYHARRDLPKVLGTVVVVFAVTILISGLLVVGFILAPQLIMTVLTKGREPVSLLLILLFLVPLESTDLLIINLFACFGRAREIFWGRYIIPPALRAIGITVVVLSRSELRFLAYGYLLVELATILLFGAIIVYELRRHSLFPSLACIELPVREIFSFSVPLMASNLIGIVGASIPVLLLGYFHSITTVAYYRVVLPAAVLSNMIPANFVPLYIPTASRLFASGDISGMNNLFWQTSLWMAVLAFPIFLATSCFAHPLTIVLYGVRYAPSAQVLAVLSLAYFVNAIFAFNDKTLKVLGEVRLLVVLNIVTSIIIVVFNLLLIPRYGVVGAAVATASGVILQTALRQLALWRCGGGIRFFEKKYVPFVLVLGSSAFALYWAEHFTPENIYIAITLVFAVSLLVLLLLKKHLRITDTFPELVRVPLVGKLFA